MTTSFTIFISIAGIAYSITICIYGLSDHHVKSIPSVYQQAFDDFFTILNTSVSIVAWLIFMSTAGTTTPLVAALFVLAEAVFVIKELINLALFYWYEIPEVNPYANAEIQRHQVLLNIALDAYQNTTKVNLISALFLTAIVAGWCLMPESLLVGAVLSVAMGIVYWEKYNAIQNINVAMEAALQTTIGEQIPWWMDGKENQAEPTEQSNWMLSNNEKIPVSQKEEHYQMHASFIGSAGRTGFFSGGCVQKQSRHTIDKNDFYSHASI